MLFMFFCLSSVSTCNTKSSNLSLSCKKSQESDWLSGTVAGSHRQPFWWVRLTRKSSKNCHSFTSGPWYHEIRCLRACYVQFWYRSCSYGNSNHDLAAALDELTLAGHRRGETRGSSYGPCSSGPFHSVLLLPASQLEVYLDQSTLICYNRLMDFGVKLALIELTF